MKLNLEYINNKFNFSNSDKLCHLENKQEYCPLIKLLLKENIKNNNAIKPRSMIDKITARYSHNIINALVNEKETPIFLKYCSILDPIKYISNKYDEDQCFKLPKKNIETFKKNDLPYNSAYVDSFFSYLSSTLLKDHHFLNGIDYYGSILANQIDYKFNIYDDLDYLCQSKEFVQNINKKFIIDDSLEETFKLSKTPLKISDENVFVIILTYFFIILF